jgi:hypothetical protein
MPQGFYAVIPERSRTYPTEIVRLRGVTLQFDPRINFRGAVSVGSVVKRNIVRRIVGATIIAGVILVSINITNGSRVRAQSLKNVPPPTVRLPDESAGIDAIVQSLISVFDQADVVALGERHGEKLDSDLRIALVRHPDFAKKVRFVVVEFGSTTSQPILDRYIRGENVPTAELERVWKTTTQGPNGLGDDPIYAEFFAAVRDVNSKLPVNARIRVLGGDPGPGDNRSRESTAVAVLKEQVLQKHGKALVIYGAAHFYRTMDQVYLSTLGGEIGIV